MIIVGDIHGKFANFQQIIDENLDENIIQIGDMGFGFKGSFPPYDFGDNTKFFLGNHDALDVAKLHKNWLGKYGYVENLGTPFYFISGAYSPWFDRKYRTPNLDWWDTEQLTLSDFEIIYDEIERIKPELILSHDCPNMVYPHLGIHNIESIDMKGNITSQFLDEICYKFPPKKFIFGHHHKPLDKVIADIRFICLPELETLEIE